MKSRINKINGILFQSGTNLHKYGSDKHKRKTNSTHRLFYLKHEALYISVFSL